MRLRRNFLECSRRIQEGFRIVQCFDGLQGPKSAGGKDEEDDIRKQEGEKEQRTIDAMGKQGRNRNTSC